MKNEKIYAGRIREQYEEKSESNIYKLRRLHAKVKRPAATIAYILGTLGALVLGIGMCFAMNVLEAGTYGFIIIKDNMMLPGIIIGLIGIIVISVNYPIYKAFLSCRKRKYAAQIIELSDKI